MGISYESREPAEKGAFGRHGLAMGRGRQSKRDMRCPDLLESEVLEQGEDCGEGTA